MSPTCDGASPSLVEPVRFSGRPEPPPASSRRKMRKGTKSCIECRRRKIRCNLEPGSTGVCKECYARGSRCIGQEHGSASSADSAPDQAYSLRERVTYLEGLVQQALHHDEGGQNSPTSSHSTASPDIRPAKTSSRPCSTSSTSPTWSQDVTRDLPNGFRQDAPALGLFDNPIIARRDEVPELSRHQYNKQKAVRQALISLLPGAQELDIILDISAKWWQSWRQLFPEIINLQGLPFKEGILRSLQSENPAEVAKVMICIAICIDQRPGDYDYSQLHLQGSGFEVMERYIARIDELITRDDEIAATVEGIECMCLQAKHYANIGRPRRAWLVHGRAISFAQLLGLHRIVLMEPRQPDMQYHRHLSLWSHLFLGERYMAVTLGLPLTIQPRFCDPLIPTLGQPSQLPQSRIVLLQTSSIMAKIVDRNQDRGLDLSTTFQIDEEMERLGRSAPQEWWGKLDAPAPSHEERFDQIFCQFFFHLARKLLHMPFMLKLCADRRYQHSYATALDSSREVIRCYDALRGTDVSVPFICKLVDFEAFCAAILILLHLHRNTRGAPIQTDEDRADSALVDTTISILRNASKEAGGIVAQQGLKALEMIAQHARGDCVPQQSDSIKVSVPFFGTITLTPGSNFQSSKGDGLTAPAETSASTATTTNNGLPTPPTAPGSAFQPSPTSLLSADPITSTSASTTLITPPGRDEDQPPRHQHSPSRWQAPQTQQPIYPDTHPNYSAPPQQASLSPSALATASSAEDFLPDYPMLSFDAYNIAPALHVDNGPGAATTLDPLYHPGHPTSAAGAATGADLHYAGGNGYGMTGLTTYMSFDPCMDLDSNWNWTSFDRSALDGFGSVTTAETANSATNAEPVDIPNGRGVIGNVDR